MNVLKIELEIPIPDNIDEASGSGTELGLVLFNKVIVPIRNAIMSAGATGNDASNSIFNAQIVSYAYTLATTIAAMEGVSLSPEHIQKKFPQILKETMYFTSEVLERNVDNGLFVLKDKTLPGEKKNGP